MAKAIDHQIELPIGAGNRYDLPDRCVITGRPGVEWYKRKFVYVPPWAYLTILLNIIILIIVALVVQKKATLELPIHPDAFRTWKRKTSKVAAGVVGGVLLVL